MSSVLNICNPKSACISTLLTPKFRQYTSLDHKIKLFFKFIFIVVCVYVCMCMLAGVQVCSHTMHTQAPVEVREGAESLGLESISSSVKSVCSTSYT